MPIRPQCPSVEPRIGNCVADLLFRSSQKFRRQRRRGDSDQQHVIEANAVETVFECQHALDFMGLNHRGEQVSNKKRRLLLHLISTTDKIGNRQQRAKVIRRMSPFGSQPGIVEIQPAN